MKKILLTILLSISIFGADIAKDKTSSLTRDDVKEIVSDSTTGLMWQDNSAANTLKTNWYKAKNNCDNLVHAGFDDWYLPSIKDLNTIVDITAYNPAIKKGFKNVISSSYWSSSPGKTHNKSALSVYFKGGGTYDYSKKDSRRAICVRVGK